LFTVAAILSYCGPPQLNNHLRRSITLLPPSVTVLGSSSFPSLVFCFLFVARHQHNTQESIATMAPGKKPRASFDSFIEAGKLPITIANNLTSI
jgi:hypothetical protein